MFVVNDDMSVYVTRGDYCNIPIAHQFKSGDVVRFKVTKKKDCNTVVIQRDFVVESATETFVISLTGTDTKIGEVISKPTDYWYEVELNPETNPQTIIGYDEDGAKILKLFPEGKDVDAEDIEVVGTKTLQELVDYALDQANKSGAFDGKDGKDGADGKDGQDGYTPVKGEDYFTEEDIDEVVEGVAKEVLPNCTNALKATASGEVVRVDDVSPIEHIAKAKVSGKNLIPTFTQDYSVTRGELTQSCEAGGNTITINGIGNSNGGGRNNFRDFTQHFFLKKGKTYTLSQQTVSGTCDGVFSVYVSKLPDSDSVTWTSNSMVRKTFVAEEDMECYIGVNVVAGVVYNNVVVRFQLEEGDTATEYEPYVDPATVEVTRCGKNLVSYPFYNKTKTENGITFTDKGNGIITVNGTATDNAFFHFVIDSTMRVKGVYTLSGLSGGSGTTYYIQPFISGTAVRGLTNGSYLYEFDGILDKITMVVAKGTTIDNLEVKLQLEQGDKATAFEPYKVGKYTPGADGTCDIIPVSPTMTLFSNTPGANIKVEYNQDTNKAMEDVRSDLRTLDNAVAELSGGLDGKITAPTTAKVGQTIVVTEVNESGKPTAWECGDLPKDGKYELIETFTFEQTSTFSRGQEPDGTPYNFEALFFHILIPAGTTVTDGSFWFYDTKGTNFAHRWTAATSNEQPLIYHGRIYRSNGIWCWYLPGEFRANGSSPIMYDEVRGNITDIVNDKKIGSIWFAQTFPVGTVINLYGVRA